MECDVGDEKKVIEVFATIKKSLGSVHVLVNNAGILRVGDLNSRFIRVQKNTQVKLLNDFFRHGLFKDS